MAVVAIYMLGIEGERKFAIFEFLAMGDKARPSLKRRPFLETLFLD